jgi:hypothetical protein
VRREREVEVEGRGVEGRMDAESGAVDEANRLGEANKKSWTLESVTSGARGGRNKQSIRGR